MHLEGSLPPATVRALAARHRLSEPALRRFRSFPGFLESFGEVCDLFRDEQDFELAASSAIGAARRAGAAHLEILFSPQVHLRRGVSIASIMTGLLRGRARAVKGRGPSVVYILDGVRQWGGEWLEEAVRAVEPYAGEGIAGLGVGGDERAVPARDFRRAYALARRLGMFRTIHAGEICGPESVWEALEILQVDRIGHGVRAIEDPELVARLARGGVPLEICPTSNIATGAVASPQSHPLRRLYACGVTVTINSDDGSMFGTDIGGELETARRWGLDETALVEVTLNAARAAFLPPRRRRALLRRVRRSATALPA